ncbi:hypothetical protein M408DRAFT_25960 [Serendipita vermifera MAFF 305830]|uniref:Uncharacterized protein n=1 Tax=Serendipita vermifera MAFF 305830 TaxID=933852 RepID=A0A0C2X8V3_SERVB|nr:hypothetical protein M408DRAFT_25960 [Serendipita vermifera MAFF 305830]
MSFSKQITPNMNSRTVTTSSVRRTLEFTGVPIGWAKRFLVRGRPTTAETRNATRRQQRGQLCVTMAISDSPRLSHDMLIVER